MSVLIFDQLTDPREISNNPYQLFCPYCKSNLEAFEVVGDIWQISNDEILEIHKETSDSYKELHNLEDCYFNLDLDSKEFEIYVNYCPTCGWWRLVKDICICAKTWQIWDIFFGYCSVLKNLNLKDIDLPLKEVSSYLVAKYEDRFKINPKVFEDVVANVFKSVGQDVLVTGYTHDGGIDVILGDSNEDFIGI